MVQFQVLKIILTMVTKEGWKDEMIARMFAEEANFRLQFLRTT